MSWYFAFLEKRKCCLTSICLDLLLKTRLIGEWMDLWFPLPIFVAGSYPQNRSCDSYQGNKNFCAAAANLWYSALQLGNATAFCFPICQDFAPGVYSFLKKNPVIDLRSVLTPLESALPSLLRTWLFCCLNTNLSKWSTTQMSKDSFWCKHLGFFCWFVDEFWRDADNILDARSQMFRKKHMGKNYASEVHDVNAFTCFNSFGQFCENHSWSSQGFAVFSAKFN